MENASKALIIAGSILLSILIIALGMYIFGQAGNSTDTSQLSALEISAFNEKFNKYEGSQTGTQVSSLLDALIANARTNDSVAEKPQVTFTMTNDDEWTDLAGTANGTNENVTENIVLGTGDDYITQLKTAKNMIRKSHRYTVDITEDDNTDLVHVITITY